MNFPITILALFTWVFAHSQNDLAKILESLNHGEIPYISVVETRMLQLQGKVVILDAREKEEFEVSHLPNAIYVGYKEFSVEKLTELIPDHNQTIAVYCSIGVRSENIAEKIKKQGYHNVRNIYGGIFEWSNKELPLMDYIGNRTNRVHTFSKEWANYLHNGIKVN